MLVGADGMHSAVRRQLLPHARLECTGLRAVTGRVPLDDRAGALLSRRMTNGVTIVSGPRGDACVVHVVDLPWDAGGRPKPGVDSAAAALLDPVRPAGSRDYVMFGFAGAAATMPRGMTG